MKKTQEALAFMVLVLAALLVFSGCPNTADCNCGGEESGGPSPGLASALPDFVSIDASGVIEGQAVSYELPNAYDYVKGVFVENRQVSLSPWYMGKEEVSYALWDEVYTWAKTRGYIFANEGRMGSAGYVNSSMSSAHPVTDINWRDCIVWCNAYTQMLSGSTDECVYRKGDDHAVVLKDATDKGGDPVAYIVDTAFADMSKKGMRLPTEAEWEYAARYQADNTNTNGVQYGSSGPWLTRLNSASGADLPLGFDGLTRPGGTSWEDLRDEAARVAVYSRWWDGTSWQNQDPSVNSTQEGGGKDANALGLYDMSGNVWEWCFDRYGSITAGSETEADPQGPDSGWLRVYRGGSCSNYAQNCSVGYRNYVTPDNRYSNLGLRLACRP